MVRTRYLVAMALLVALAGCGGGGDDVPTAAEDKAAAERVVFSEDDFPGFTREDEDEEDEDDPFRACTEGNVLLTELGNGPRAAEASFNNEDGDSSRASAVNFAETEEEAEEAFDALTASEFAACFEEAIRTGFEDSLGDDAGIENLSVTELPDQGLGDDNVGFRGMLDLVDAEDGERLALSFDYVFYRVGRGLVVLFAFDLEDTLATGERATLSNLLVDRLEAEV